MTATACEYLDRRRGEQYSAAMVVNQSELIGERHRRLLAVMTEQDVPAVLTSNPINILYATGVRNMTVFSLMGPFRFALILAKGPVLLWEFAGCEHLVADNPVVTEVRPAPGVSPIWGASHSTNIAGLVREIAELLGDGDATVFCTLA